MNASVEPVEGRLPTFVIVGAKKSGTSSLNYYLRTHPEVFIPSDEVHFFDQTYDEGVGAYAKWFEGAGDKIAIGEGTPTYLYSSVIPHRMSEVLPSVKVIAILRNPVDRAYSHHWMRHARHHTSGDFASAIAGEMRLLSAEGWDAIDGGLLHQGLYEEHLRRFEAPFGRDRMFVCLFDDLVGDPAGLYASLCQFIGVDDSYMPTGLGRRVTPYVTHRSHRVWRLSRNLPKGLRKIVGRANTRRTTYPPMDPALRAELTAFYAEGNAKLARWLGRDLRTWDSEGETNALTG